MADYQAVALGIKPADPNQAFNSINSILGMQQKRQALQVQGQQLQQEQLATQEQQGLSDFFTQWSPGDHVGADGTTDLDSAHSSGAYKGLPGNARAAVDQKLIQIKQGQISNASTLLGLTKDQIGLGSQLLGPLSQDKDVIAGGDDGKAKVQAALKQWGDLGGAAGAKVALTYQKMTDGNLKDGELPIRIQALMKQADNALLKQSAVSVGTGAATQFGTQDPLTGTTTMGGPSVPNKVAPGANILTDANGKQFVYDPQKNSVTPVGAGAPTAGGGSAGAPANKPQFVQGTSDPEAVKQNVEGARQAGDLAPLNEHINDQLIRLSKDTSTGYGTRGWQKAIGAISGGKFGADYQTIGAYLDRQAAMSQRAMGLPDTNAGLAASQGLTGTTEYAPEALQTKVKLADTLNTAARQFRQGLDRVIGVGGNQDNSKYQAFRSAWSANFDPQVFAAENALRRGDTEELNKIKKEEGPAGMAALSKKRAALTALSKGQMPQ